MLVVTGPVLVGIAWAALGPPRRSPSDGVIGRLRNIIAHPLPMNLENDPLVEGQTEGSVPLGQGQALTEDVVQRDGQVLNPNFATYFMPTAADAPRVKSIIVETVDPNGPFGAKEASESINIAIVPALASAVEQAVGANIQTLPITPEKVLAALEQG